MSLVAIRCQACGGAVAASEQLVRCLFCGASALVAVPEEAVEPPGSYLPFDLDEAAAKAEFQRMAGGIFRPARLGQGSLVLRRLLLPAWVFTAKLETHYAAIIPDSSVPGSKRPIAGAEAWKPPPVLVPASSALTLVELAAIAPFKDDSESPFDADHPPAPVEIGLLSRGAAESEARKSLLALHERNLVQRHKASFSRVSALFSEVEGRPLLLPIWIAAFRHGDRVYRVVINGQSGKLTGNAPYSLIRVGLAIFAILMFALWCALCGGLLSSQ